LVWIDEVVNDEIAKEVPESDDTVRVEPVMEVK